MIACWALFMGSAASWLLLAFAKNCSSTKNSWFLSCCSSIQLLKVRPNNDSNITYFYFPYRFRTPWSSQPHVHQWCGTQHHWTLPPQVCFWACNHLGWWGGEVPSNLSLTMSCSTLRKCVLPLLYYCQSEFPWGSLCVSSPSCQRKTKTCTKHLHFGYHGSSLAACYASLELAFPHLLCSLLLFLAVIDTRWVNSTPAP